MPRYIDAEKLVEHKFLYVTYDRYVSDGIRKSEEEVYAYKVGYNEAIDSIAQFEPTADVVEVKHGNWVGFDDDPCETFECDRCGFVLDDWIQGALYNFCPNCGADMRKETEDGKNK